MRCIVVVCDSKNNLVSWWGSIDWSEIFIIARMTLDLVNFRAFNLRLGNFMQLSQLDLRKTLSATLLVLIKKVTADGLAAILALNHELLVFFYCCWRACYCCLLIFFIRLFRILFIITMKLTYWDLISHWIRLYFQVFLFDFLFSLCWIVKEPKCELFEHAREATETTLTLSCSLTLLSIILNRHIICLAGSRFLYFLLETSWLV